MRDPTFALASGFLIAGGILFFGMRRAAAAPGESGGSSSDYFGAWGGAADSAGEVVADVVDIVGEVAQNVGLSAWSMPYRGAPYAERIAAAEDRHGLPRNLLARQLYEESRYRPEVINGQVKSSAGAVGIAQFMPATAADLGIDPLNVDQAIDAAARYMAQLYRSTGDWSLALAAYNWGIGNVQRKGMAAAPRETRNYVAAITGDVPVA